jgi:hypothetical protein
MSPQTETKTSSSFKAVWIYLKIKKRNHIKFYLFNKIIIPNLLQGI